MNLIAARALSSRGITANPGAPCSSAESERALSVSVGAHAVGSVLTLTAVCPPAGIAVAALGAIGFIALKKECEADKK